MKLVSVVMPTYNNGPYLRVAIDSILNQTYTDFELIIVDDASTDNAAEILSSYKDPRIRVIRHDVNAGVSISRNDGMNASVGEYIAVMDGDDVSYPLRLELQVKFLDSHPDYVVVGCSVYDNIDLDGSLLFRTQMVSENEEIQRTLVQKWCFHHASIMFRRELLDQINGYRKEFVVAEDHDFLLRALEHGKAYNIDANLTAYRINLKSLTMLKMESIAKYEKCAIDLSKKRRAGESENLEEIFSENVTNFYSNRSTISKIKNKLGMYFYVSRKYYGFGCKQFYVSDLNLARKCFIRSIRCNILFIYSWIGLILTFLPIFIQKRIRFIFSGTVKYYTDLENIK